MLSIWIGHWLESLAFLSDKVRILCAEVLAILLLGVFIYAVAKLVKAILQLVLEREFIRKRWPRLSDAVRVAHMFGAIGYTVAAMLIIHLYGFFIPPEGGLLHSLVSRLVGIYATMCFMQLLVSGVNVIDYLYGRNPNVPLRGVFQAIKIVLVLLGILIVISIIISKRPMYVITGLSAAAAVFMLVFKDPIYSIIMFC